MSWPASERSNLVAVWEVQSMRQGIALGNLEPPRLARCSHTFLSSTAEQKGGDGRAGKSDGVTEERQVEIEQ